MSDPTTTTTDASGGVGGPPPLSWPDYEISFADAVKRAYKKYVDFNGRASRAEFWYFYLFVVGVTLVLVLPSIAIGVALNPQGGLGPIPTIGLSLAGLFYFGSLLPIISAAVRRLHDAGYTGLFLLLGLITGLIPLIMCMLPTSPAAAQYGPPGQPGHPGQPQLAGGYPAQPGYGPAPYGGPNAYGAAPGYPQTGGAPQGYGGQPPYPQQDQPAYPPQGSSYPPHGAYPQQGQPSYPPQDQTRRD